MLSNRPRWPSDRSGVQIRLRRRDRDSDLQGAVCWRIDEEIITANGRFLFDQALTREAPVFTVAF